MRVLAIGANPVDLLVAAGGTLQLYAASGSEPHAVIVGTEAPSADEHRRHQSAFADVSTTLMPLVGVERLDDERLARDALMDTIREVAPEVIIGPSGESTRASERALSRLVFGAAYCACVPNYPSPGGVEASSVRAVILHTDPTLRFASGTPDYVDIDGAWEQKQQAIRRFPDAETHLAAADALGGARGVQVQRERAEAFGQEPTWGRLRPFRVLP